MHCWILRLGALGASWSGGPVGSEKERFRGPGRYSQIGGCGIGICGAPQLCHISEGRTLLWQAGEVNPQV